MDWFASEHNKKVDRFYSRYWNPFCEGIDAFTADWGVCTGWFVPPIYLISRVVKYCQMCKARGTLIVPLWVSSSFWPLLFPGGRFLTGIVDWVDIPTTKEDFVSSPMSKRLFGNEDLKFRMLAFKFDFSLFNN